MELYYGPIGATVKSDTTPLEQLFPSLLRIRYTERRCELSVCGDSLPPPPPPSLGGERVKCFALAKRETDTRVYENENNL
jgi:hypothetical protein